MKKQIKAVVEFWGNEMPMLACEEAGEFIQAVSKLERFYNGKSTKNQLSEEELRRNLIEEIGDLNIATAALEKHYNIKSSDIADYIEKKLRKKY